MNDTYLLCLVKAINWELKDQDPVNFPAPDFDDLLERQSEAVKSFRALMNELSLLTEDEALAWWADHVGPRYPFPNFLFN